MVVKVKVCGITNLADAEKALESGADALGFNFYAPSPRYLSPEKARAIVHALPAAGCNVALFVNETKERVHQVLSSGVLDDGRQGYQAVQFHGDENEGYCRDWDLRVIKAFRLKDRDSARQVDNFPADYYLLDSWSAGYGGSGTSFPWEWLDGLNPEKIILSGGLNLRNIAEAVRRIRPYGVDVCSGVEVRPGVKDHEKIKEFILAAKGA